jgi:hypothetical protein
MLFTILYAVALIVNVKTNEFMLETLPNYTFSFLLHSDTNEILKSLVIGVDKLTAFVLATTASVALTYIGQKYWIFKAEKADTNTEV